MKETIWNCGQLVIVKMEKPKIVEGKTLANIACNTFYTKFPSNKYGINHILMKSNSVNILVMNALQLH